MSVYLLPVQACWGYRCVIPWTSIVGPLFLWGQNWSISSYVKVQRYLGISVTWVCMLFLVLDLLGSCIWICSDSILTCRSMYSSSRLPLVDDGKSGSCLSSVTMLLLLKRRSRLLGSTGVLGRWDACRVVSGVNNTVSTSKKLSLICETKLNNHHVIYCNWNPNLQHMIVFVKCFPTCQSKCLSNKKLRFF